MAKNRPIPTPKFDDELDKFINASSKESKNIISEKSDNIAKSIKKEKKNTSEGEKKKETEIESMEGEKKLGRPMIEGELLNKKLIASVTEEEYDKIDKKRGLVSVSTYLRTKMREAGII